MLIENPESYFRAVAARARDARLRDLVGTWQIDVDGAGTWCIQVDHGALDVKKGPVPAPTTRFRFDAAEFLRLSRGENHENLVSALLRGEVRELDGDVAFAQKLQALLPFPSGEVTS